MGIVPKVVEFMAGLGCVNRRETTMRFTAIYRKNDSGCIILRIVGRAFVCSEASLIERSDDPYRYGIS